MHDASFGGDAVRSLVTATMHDSSLGGVSVSGLATPPCMMPHLEEPLLSVLVTSIMCDATVSFIEYTQHQICMKTVYSYIYKHEHV